MLSGVIKNEYLGQAFSFETGHFWPV